MPLEQIAPQVAALDDLRSIELEAHNLLSLSRTLQAIPPVERLALRYTTYMPHEEEFASLASAGNNGFKILDLRSIQVIELTDVQNGNPGAEVIARALLRTLPSAARSLDQIWLGRWWTQELADALTRRGVEVRP
jgi:hypothetical protein